MPSRQELEEFLAKGGAVNPKSPSKRRSSAERVTEYYIKQHAIARLQQEQRLERETLKDYKRRVYWSYYNYNKQARCIAWYSYNPDTKTWTSSHSLKCENCGFVGNADKVRHRIARRQTFNIKDWSYIIECHDKLCMRPAPRSTNPWDIVLDPINREPIYCQRCHYAKRKLAKIERMLVPIICNGQYLKRRIADVQNKRAKAKRQQQAKRHDLRNVQEPTGGERSMRKSRA